MKNLMITLSIVLSLCSALRAQPAPKPVAAPPAVAGKAASAPRVMDPAARSNMLAKTGGIIQSPATGPAILFLNTQKRVPAQAFHETPDQIQKILRLPCLARDKTSSEPVAEAVKALADTNTAAVIVIGDSPGYPALLVAPESRWALVNVAALGGADVTADKLAERVQKEVWRAFGYVMGAANSNLEPCLLKPVLSTADLDALIAKSLCPEPFNKILAQAKKLGLKSNRTTTYRKAVEEGWARAPTNDFQRAIWQELKK